MYNFPFLYDLLIYSLNGKYLNVRSSWKQEDMAYLVSPGVILLTFSADSRPLLSSGDEDPDKLPFDCSKLVVFSYSLFFLQLLVHPPLNIFTVNSLS